MTGPNNSDSMPCPACGKTLDLAAQDACSRCDCELHSVKSARTAARQRLHHARRALRQGDYFTAASHARQSWRLHHTRTAAQMVILAEVALDQSGPCSTRKRTPNIGPWLQKATG